MASSFALSLTSTAPVRGDDRQAAETVSTKVEVDRPDSLQNSPSRPKRQLKTELRRSRMKRERRMAPQAVVEMFARRWAG
jgi:hypothetical protein